METLLPTKRFNLNNFLGAPNYKLYFSCVASKTLTENNKNLLRLFCLRKHYSCIYSVYICISLNFYGIVKKSLQLWENSRLHLILRSKNKWRDFCSTVKADPSCWIKHLCAHGGSNASVEKVRKPGVTFADAAAPPYSQSLWDSNWIQEFSVVDMNTVKWLLKTGRIKVAWNKQMQFCNVAA